VEDVEIPGIHASSPHSCRGGRSDRLRRRPLFPRVRYNASVGAPPRRRQRAGTPGRLDAGAVTVPGLTPEVTSDVGATAGSSALSARVSLPTDAGLRRRKGSALPPQPEHASPGGSSGMLSTAQAPARRRRLPPGQPSAPLTQALTSSGRSAQDCYISGRMPEVRPRHHKGDIHGTARTIHAHPS